MAEAQKETHFFRSEAQVRGKLRALGAVNVPGSRSEYSARGGKRVLVRAVRDGFAVIVVPPGCAC